MTNAKNSRVTNVQVPGTPQNHAPDLAKESAEAAAAANAGGATQSGPEADATAGHPIPNLEALRAQIREEERAILRDELGKQIQAASAAIGGTPAPAHSKADYRTMHAADIDPTTLTAPVMTLDGYLCPPAPEAKK